MAHREGASRVPMASASAERVVCTLRYEVSCCLRMFSRGSCEGKTMSICWSHRGSGAVDRFLSVYEGVKARWQSVDVPVA